MRAKKSKGKGAAAADPDVDDEIPADAAASVQELAKISPARAMEIAAAGGVLAAQIEIIIKREEKLSKQLASLRQDRKSKTRDMIQLWKDELTGQASLPLREESSAAAPALTPGHAESQAYVGVFGDRALRVETFEPGSWIGSIDDMAVCEARAAIDAIAGVCSALELPESSGVRSAANWKPAKPSSETHATMHVAFYKGRRMAIVQDVPGERWKCSIRTGLAVASSVGEFDGEAEAKAAALVRAGYDSKDLRPVWHRASRAKAHLAAAHARVFGALPARLFRATYQGFRFEVQVEKDGTIRAMIDDSYGGEHTSIEKAKKWCLEKHLGRKLKKGDAALLTWGEIQSGDAYLKEPLNVEYGALVGGKGGKVVVLRQTEPGRWTGRVDGSPVAIGMHLDVAKKEVAKFLGVKPEELALLRTETSEVFGGAEDAAPPAAKKQA